MATHEEAEAAREAVLAVLVDVLGFRPEGSGIVRMHDRGYGLKIYLSRRPDTEPPPSSVLGVPLEYSIFTEPPELKPGLSRDRHSRL